MLYVCLIRKWGKNIDYNVKPYVYTQMKVNNVLTKVVIRILRSFIKFYITSHRPNIATAKLGYLLNNMS